MLECLILGDSIGNGIASVSPACVSITEIGLSSDAWYKKYHERPLLDIPDYRYVVISLGSNDGKRVSRDSLVRIRKKITTKNVIWILPSAEMFPQQNQLVFSLAREYGDAALDISAHVGKDRVHPPTVKAYEDIGKKIKDSVK